MTVENLKQQLEYTGCQLCLDGDNIRYRFSGKQIPDDANPLLQELRTHKAEMVALLKPVMKEAYIKFEPPPVRSFETVANEEIQPLLYDINYQMPYMDKHNDLVIPFKADPKYFYWNAGQPIESTLDELNISAALWSKYSSKIARNN